MKIDFELRKWDREFADDLAIHANNKNIAANLRDAFPHPYTKKDAKDYIAHCIANEGRTQICRAIYVNDEAVGSVGIFIGEDVYRKSAEIGYWLSEKYWDRGIMSQAVKSICEKAFERFDIVRIYAEPFYDNTPSRKVLDNAGFSLEGVMINGVYKNDQIKDYCMYALVR